MRNVVVKKRKKSKKKKKSRVDVEDTALAPPPPRADAEAEEDDDEDYDETISLEAGVDGERGELIDIEFSFNDPSETDFHSVRNLVRRSFFASILTAPGGKGKASAADVAVALDANVSSLADSIVGQLECCSVVQAVKDEDEDDAEEEEAGAASGGASSSSAAAAGAVAASVPSAGDGGTFGVILALPLALAKLQSSEWLGALRACLLGKAPAAARDVLKTLFSGRAANGGTAALLVSIRLVNLPNELVPHMYDALCQDVAWVRENALLAEHDAAAQKAFRFTQYIFLAPCTTRGGADGSAGAAPKRKKQKRAGGAGGSALQFERFEVQALYKAATVKFDFALAKPSPLGDGAGGAEGGPPTGPPRRLAVMVLPAAAVQKRALPWMRTIIASSVAGR